MKSSHSPQVFFSLSFPRTSLSIFKFSPCNHTATQLTALCADAVMWVTLPVRKLPIFLILLSRTLHLREVCVKFSRSVVSASWWPKQPTALQNDAPLYFSWQTPDLSQPLFLDLSVAFTIALSKLEPEVVYGRTFIKICQQPPLQQSARSASFPRFPKPEQRRLKTRQS